jgi:hypothetical protein|nr:ESPR-type extended signal peptide-containing protein [uncultured Dialister sp.]
MNKIFKVIFSKAKGCYVVVSELAKSTGGGTPNLKIKRGYTLTLAAAVVSMLLGLAPVGAADPVNLGNGGTAAYDDKGNLTVGKVVQGQSTDLKGENNTAIGTKSDTLRNITEGETTKNGQPMDEANTKLVDGEGVAHKLETSTESGGSTAVGYNNKAEGDNSTAIGNNAKIINKPITYYADKDGNKTTSTDNAAWYKDSSGNPTEVPQVFRDADGNTTTTPQYVHTYTEKDPTTGEEITKTEITSDATKADQKDGKPVYNYRKSDNLDKLYSVTLYQAASNSIAAGSNVTANGNNAVAVGYNSTADNSAVAVGDTAVASENAVAIGKNTNASVEGSIALGKGSEADRSGGTTGWDPKTGTTSTQSGLAWKSTEGALSVGSVSVSRQITGVAAGSEDTDAVNLAQLKNAMTHYYSVKTTADTDVAGNNNYLNDGATGDNALAAGVNAKASGDNSTAVGYNTSAAGTGATAIGNGSKVTNGGVAVGNGATASGDGAAFGTTGVTASSGGLAVGISGTTASDRSVAAGLGVNASSGALAVGMYGTNASSNSAAFGLNRTSASNYSVAVGTNGTTASNSSVAVGSTATANNSSFAAGFSSSAGTKNSSSSSGTSIAVGSNTTANDESSAFGINATASDHSLAIGLSGNSSNAASASNYSIAVGNAASAKSSANSNVYSAIAIGNSANASSYQATALGTSASASGYQATAFGTSANANGYQATAIGNGAGAHDTSATALGNGAAANYTYDTAIGSSASASGGNATALGYNAKANNSYATALGSGASAYYYATALGNNAQSNAEGGIALGSNSTAYRASGTTGLDTVTGALSTSTEPAWKSTYGALSIGNISSDGTVNGTRQITGVAAGSQDTDAVNVAQLKAALRQTGTGTIHDYSVNSANTTTDTNYNYDADTGSNALAAGVSAKATGGRSVAVGNGAKAQGADSIAIGTNAVATGQGAMVIGQYNTAEGQNSLAFGGGYNDPNKGNKASSTAAVAFGEGSWAVSEGSVAFGYGTQAGNTIKDNNDKYTGQNAVAFGNGTKALGGRSLAFGENTTANFNDSVAFGNGATAFSSGATAFGNRSRALSQYATSFGDNSVAAGSMSFAFGTDTIAGAALDDNGALELTDGSRMDSYGNKAYTTTDAAGKTITYHIPNMGIPSGGDIHDYVVVTGTKADGTTGTYVEDYQGGIVEVKVNDDGTVTKVKDLYSGKYGGWYQYDEQGNIIQTGTGKNKKPAVVSSDTLKAQNKPIPVTLDKATPGSNGYTLKDFKNATAFGYSTEASGDNATAFGNDTKAKAAAATAFGTTTTASGVNATAFGLSTTASGDNATAFGEGSTASGEAATAFGISSTASGKNSLAALGGTASAENAAAIGSGAQATLADSVALGSNSMATRAKYSALTDAKERAAYAKGSSTGAAWEATANAVAIGNDGTVTRQLTGVAAGSLETDAVNVAQLKAVDAKHTIVTVGGNSVTADNTPVNGGNLDLKRTTATNGQETYDLSLDKDVTLGKQVENEGGKLTVNNVDKFKNYDNDGHRLPDTTVKEAVKIDGKTVSVVKHDGSAADNDQRQVVLGVDQDAGGYVALFDNTGKKPTYIFNAISNGVTYLKNKNNYPEDEANEFNRLEYGDIYNGSTQFIATLDDGQKYAGDNYEAAKTETKTVDGKTTTTITKEEQNVLLKKLNERLDIKGGATGALTDNNIGVNVKDGVMKVQLAQNLDLTDKGSVKMGNTTINNGGVTITPTGVTDDNKKISLTDKGLSNGGKQITHVDSGLKDAAGNPVDLAAASEDVLNNAVNVGDLQKVSSAHTAVTVNGSVEAPDAGVDGKLGKYTDKEKGNLLLAQKKDTTGKITYDLKLNDNVILGKNGTDGQEGTIGLTGKDGVPGTDSKQGYSTTIIKTEKGQKGADGKTGKENLGGTDITRIVYTDKDGSNPQTVATLSDGLKFAGDDMSTTVDKKLNETLQIRGDGTYDETTHTTKADGNIQVSADKVTGTIKVALNKDINLKQDGSLTVGGDTQDGSTTVQDPIIIKHFDVGKLIVTGTDKNGNTPQSKAGDYVTGLDNKDWDVDYPTYVSGRAATEDQLKVISDTIKSNAETAAGQHTEITVNDKKAPTIVTADKVGTTDYGDYVGGNDNLLIAAKKDSKSNKMTYNIKLNDQLAIGMNGTDGQDGKDGKDGKVTVETKGGTTVVIGHNGADGDNGKDGLFVTGKDGKDGKSGVSITGPNGATGADGVDGKVGIVGKDGNDAVSIAGKDGIGRIGLTGQKGADGKDGVFSDLSTILGTATLDPAKNEQSKSKDTVSAADKSSRIQYQTTVTDKGGKTKVVITHEVATMDDGLKFVGNDGQEVTRKLNTTLSIKGGLDKDDVAKASSKNLGVRKSGDGLEIVMTDTPNFTKVTVGGDKKITIGEQTVTGKKSDGTDGTAETGNYITGLDNTKWNKDNVVENRAATEGQLRDIAGSITNQQQGGGFALTSDEQGADKVVKQDLGKAIQIKGDTTYKADGTVEKAGNIKTSIDNGAIKVELSKDVDLGDNGSIKAGNTTINNDGVDTNKVTIKDSTISITKDGINAGSKQITNVASGASEIIKGTDGKDVYKYDNETNAANIGDVKRIAGNMKTEITNNVTDVTNKVKKMGDELTQVQQDVKADRTYQGDDAATKKNVNVKFGSFLSLTGGAKVADLTEEGNIGVVQKEVDDPANAGQKMMGLSVRLAKHLNLEKTTYTTNENGKDSTSEIDGKGLTIQTGDANRTITVQDGNVNMGGNQIHNVAPGKAPTDAVNVSQLAATNQNISNLGGEVSKLGTRVNRVGANAAALAALHPLDFDPDDKWDFAAGYGNYKNANAAAIGAYYRPNEDTMFSVGGSFGGGENMVNAGISVKLGQGNHVSTSRVAMAKEIKDLRKDVADLKAVVNQQSALIDKLTGVNAGQLSGSDELFPDVPSNHWAYEYVTKLRQAGILTGYPDGNFAGDRMMTRYEFAAIVYRAIMAGAAANPNLNRDGTLDRLAKEFSGEMKYIRIDTIRKDRNGKPTIQRVRVIKEEEK